MKRLGMTLLVLCAISCTHEKERGDPLSPASAEANSGAPKPANPAAPTQAAPAVASTTQPAAQPVTPSAAPLAAAPPSPTQTPVPAAITPAGTAAAAAIGKAPGPGLLALPVNDKSIINLMVRFASGAIDDPQGKAGVTALTARLMTEGGTQALDSKQLLNALFPLAAELDVRVDKELTTFTARVHKDNLDQFLPIFIDVILHPRWDAKEFARLREAALNDVSKRLRQGDDENLGKESLEELIFRGHPYGRLTEGHLTDLKSLTLPDLQTQAKRLFTADRLTVGVSGGYRPGLGEKLLKTLSALPATSEARALPPVAVRNGPRFELIEKQADSTALSMGLPWGLSQADPDWAAMSIARSAFGEHRQFNGRLMNRLREQRGLNYGDYAYIEYFEQEGGDAATAQLGRARHQQQFSIWVRPVQNDNRLFALRAALFELDRSLNEEPFSQAEVDQTQGFLDGYLLLFDQTDARRLGYALDDAFYGQQAFLSQWRASLRNLTAAQVNAAWKKWVDPTKLQIVLAGPNMAEVKKVLLDGSATPIHYPNPAEKDAALLATDKLIEKMPFGAQGDTDVEIVRVEQLFQ